MGARFTIITVLKPQTRMKPSILFRCRGSKRFLLMSRIRSRGLSEIKIAFASLRHQSGDTIDRLKECFSKWGDNLVKIPVVEPRFEVEGKTFSAHHTASPRINRVPQGGSYNAASVHATSSPLSYKAGQSPLRYKILGLETASHRSLMVLPTV